MFSIPLVKTSISNRLVKIVNRQIILRTLILDYIILSHNMTNLVFNFHSSIRFFNNQKINPDRFFAEIIFPRELQMFNIFL